MRKKAVTALIVLAVSCAAAVCSAQTPRGTTAPAGARRGFGRGFGGRQFSPPGPPAPVPPEVAMARPTLASTPGS